MANITVLFGAGAECQFNLSGGEDFSKNVLGINKPNLNLAVEKYYVEKHFENLNKWFPPYQKTQWKTYDLFKASVKKYLIDKEIDIPSAQNFDLQLRKEIRRIKGEEKKNIKNKYPSYMGLLDEQFHALIAPCALEADKFWNVVACYTRAYLTLTAQIIFSAKRTISVNDYLCLLNDPQKAIRSIRATCSSDTRFHGESYYSILKKHSNISVVTTNYTPCCEILSNMASSQIAYVHGRFGLFESPYEWRVYDVDKEDQLPTDTLLFPYIFVQSGIKPIVDRIQIQEYHKMLNFFDSSERIVIVGYRINADDNHINGMLRSAITAGKKKVIYLDYDTNSSEDIIRKRLRLTNESKNFIWRPINEKNSLSVFEKNLSN